MPAPFFLTIDIAWGESLAGPPPLLPFPAPSSPSQGPLFWYLRRSWPPRALRNSRRFRLRPPLWTPLLVSSVSRPPPRHPPVTHGRLSMDGFQACPRFPDALRFAPLSKRSLVLPPPNLKKNRPSLFPSDPPISVFAFQPPPPTLRCPAAFFKRRGRPFFFCAFPGRRFDQFSHEFCF